MTSELERPFNVLAPFFRGVSIDDLAGAGARRISVGSALHLATLQPLLNAGAEMLERGTFGWTRGMASSGDIGRLLD